MYCILYNNYTLNAIQACNATAQSVYHQDQISRDLCLFTLKTQVSMKTHYQEHKLRIIRLCIKHNPHKCGANPEQPSTLLLFDIQTQVCCMVWLDMSNVTEKVGSSSMYITRPSTTILKIFVPHQLKCAHCPQIL